jgi:hypothetical protein
VNATDKRQLLTFSPEHAVSTRMIAVCVVFAVACSPSPAFAQAKQSDREVAESIVRECRAIYHTDGKPCACPDDLGRDRTPCGQLSAYSKSAGAAPKCYVGDVTPEEIADYRANNTRFLVRCVSR